MQSTRGKSVLWDPSPSPSSSNRLLVGGGAELRLYSHQPGQGATTFTATTAVTELAGLRAFSWASHAAFPLVAAGLSTGRVLLLRLDEGAKDDRTRAPAAVQINVRHSRPCNVVTFCPDEPGLLAVGLEKGRGESLLVYDVSRSLDSSSASTSHSHLGAAPGAGHRAFSLQRDASQSGRGRGNSPASGPSSSSSADPTPLVSFGSSEVVTSAAFLSSPSSPGSSASHTPLLAAAMANKWLRVYDLRSPPSTVTTWSTRAVYGIAANPFHGQQFTSHGDDGVVRLWDLRKPMDPLLAWSETDAGSISAQKMRANVVARPLGETAWSPETRGQFATLEKDASRVRVWNLVDGPGPRLVGAAGPAARGSGGGAGGRSAGLGGPDASAGARDGRDDRGEEKEALRMPIVLDDRQTHAFQHSLISFAFARTPSSSPHDLHFVGLSRDSSNPGSSGQRLELVTLPAAPHAAFLERGILLTTSTDEQTVLAVPSSSALAAADAAEGEHAIALPSADPHNTSISPHTPAALQLSVDPLSPQLDRGRQLSLAGLLHPVDRNATPRPGLPGGGLLRRISSGPVPQLGASSSPAGGAHGEFGGGSSSTSGGLAALATDMSVVIRQRVDAGYGSDALVNAALCDGGIAEFWQWVARAQSLSSENSTSDYDYRFRGVLRILLGFPSGMTNPALSSGASSPNGTGTPPSPVDGPHSAASSSGRRTPTPRSIYSDISRSLRRGDEAQSRNAAYTAACATLVARRRLANTFAISSSQFAAQRKIALSACGAEWEEGWEAVCDRLAKKGDHEAAARHAFFSGQMERAMNHLRSCKDENLRMLAPIIAAYLAQKDTLRNASSESNYAALCRSLSSDVETPWVRAMFAFLATSDWRELVDEMGLPLKDRVAVALRFLSDSELIPFLQELGDEALSSSDLEAVVLFGLRNDGLKLLSAYVDRSGDVQTVALACSFTSPGLIRADMRVQRWVETYRAQLDRLQLYAARAMFDAARGRRARAAFEQARLAGRNAEAKEVAGAMRRTAPPQIVVRCQFCATNIAPSKGAGMLGELNEGGRGTGGQLGVKSTLCPSCSKQVPACCICLERPSLHSFDAHGPATLCWCQRCRHGGHASHLLAWFETSEVCAVAGCDCECNSGR
ncbi:hypothetical protein JCM8208_007290 [Rhodotorula glutinis]